MTNRDKPEMTIRVWVTDDVHQYSELGNKPGALSEQVQATALAALGADRGLDAKANEPTRTHPVLIAVRDPISKEGSYKAGAISPENPHYATFAAVLKGTVAIPEKVREYPTLNESLIPSRLREDPFYPGEKKKLLAMMAASEDSIAEQTARGGHRYDNSDMFLAEMRESPVRQLEGMVATTRKAASTDAKL